MLFTYACLVALSFCCFIQYVHKICTNLVYYYHKPQETPLPDLGFDVIPEIPIGWQFVSEIVFFIPIVMFIFYCVSQLLLMHFFVGWDAGINNPWIIILRFGLVAGIASLLRCCCFLSTILPGPRYHCRLCSEEYKPPKDWQEIFSRTDMFAGCGDLIFSSHASLMLVASKCLITYWSHEFVWGCWSLYALFCVLAIGCRKHYTVDFIVATIIVPLLFNESMRTITDEQIAHFINLF